MAETLLPDVLPDDHTCPTSYSINGRAPTDDVVDVFLAAFTNGKVAEDEGVGAGWSLQGGTAQ